MGKDNQIGRLVVFHWIGYAPQISASQVESDSVSEVLARLAAISSREKAEGISYGIPMDTPWPMIPPLIWPMVYLCLSMFINH